MSATRPVDGSELESGEGLSCVRCKRRPAGFSLARMPMCLWCVFRYPPLLKRSLLTAAVVGTLLVIINQGTFIASGDLPGDLVWKVPLTYAVPFTVATWGALVNSRLR